MLFTFWAVFVCASAFYGAKLTFFFETSINLHEDYFQGRQKSAHLVLIGGAL